MRDMQDNLDALAIAVYGRRALPHERNAGHNARIFSDAAEIIEQLRREIRRLRSRKIEDDEGPNGLTADGLPWL